MRLQHGPGLAGDSLTDVEIPVSSGTVDGVDCSIPYSDPRRRFS
jgi:hypothetical protein